MVRVRFAPSPTGALHIGGLRTALYNYLFAKHFSGTMILRIEDTDQARLVAGAEDYILESLDWVGIKIDEGVGVGGVHSPYRQSERKHIYQTYVNQLIDSGHAYYAFDTAQELEDMRQRRKNDGHTQQHYNSATRMEMVNSFTLTEEKLKKYISENSNMVVRLKVDPDEELVIKDLIRGEIKVNTSDLDDKVLMKSDGMPTYHLANVVDDSLMQISHVIRGEEWIPSLPHHVLLYRCLGWESIMPQFAHLPLLLKPDGKGKLSKRDSEQFGFPIFPINWINEKSDEKIIGFREAGYLPEALINFIALLGWNPGTEQEIFSMQNLIKEFSLERIGKAGARFDIQKAQWFNQQYIQNINDDELEKEYLSILEKEKIECNPQKAKLIVEAMKSRITFAFELWTQGKFFFLPPREFDNKVIERKWNEGTIKVLKDFEAEIRNINPINATEAKQIFEKITQGKIKEFLQVLRTAITGKGSGPDLMLIIEILGGQEVAERIMFAINNIKRHT